MTWSDEFSETEERDRFPSQGRKASTLRSISSLGNRWKTSMHSLWSHLPSVLSAWYLSRYPDAGMVEMFDKAASRSQLTLFRNTKHLIPLINLAEEERLPVLTRLSIDLQILAWHFMRKRAKRHNWTCLLSKAHLRQHIIYSEQGEPGLSIGEWQTAVKSAKTKHSLDEEEEVDVRIEYILKEIEEGRQKRGGSSDRWRKQPTSLRTILGSALSNVRSTCP